MNLTLLQHKSLDLDRWCAPKARRPRRLERRRDCGPRAVHSERSHRERAQKEREVRPFEERQFEREGGHARELRPAVEETKDEEGREGVGELGRG
jgi:hypothetical protein